MTKSHLLNRKIAFFIPSLQGGGAEKVIMNLANGLAEHGLKIDVVLVKAKGEFLSNLSPKVQLIDLKVSRVLTSLPKLASYLKKNQPDILLAALDHANIISIFAKLISRVPTKVIVSVHAPVSLNFKKPKTLNEKIIPSLIRKFYPKADAIVSSSRGIKDDLINNYGLNGNRIHIIYNPVINSELYDLSQKDFSHPWFGPKQPPVLLSVGRLSAEKDYPTLIKAFHKVRQQRPARLMIFGEGEERPKLEKLVKKLSLINDVILPGFVHNPYPFMRKASCFILSSRFEGFGNVLVEALAMNCPVISTNCPTGPAEILEEGKWGALVPIGNHEIMADAILTKLDHKKEDFPLFLRTYLQRFRIEDIMPQYLNVISNCIATCR